MDSLPILSGNELNLFPDILSILISISESPISGNFPDKLLFDKLMEVNCRQKITLSGTASLKLLFSSEIDVSFLSCPMENGIFPVSRL